VEVKYGTYQDGIPWLLAEVRAESLIAAVMTDDVDNEVQNEVLLCYWVLKDQNYGITMGVTTPSNGVYLESWYLATMDTYGYMDGGYETPFHQQLVA